MLPIVQRFKQQSTVGIIADQVILHSLGNAYNFESGVSGLLSGGNELESHYVVRQDGYIVQLVPENMRAEANYGANRRANGHGAISIETDSSVSATEPWTDAQCAALIELVAGICDRHNIPVRLCPAWDQPGIGWHIMFGSPGPWTPARKVCPGPARIRQVADVILPGVRRLLSKGIPEGDKPAPAPVPAPTPSAPTPTVETDMYEKPQRDELVTRLDSTRTVVDATKAEVDNLAPVIVATKELLGNIAPILAETQRLVGLVNVGVNDPVGGIGAVLAALPAAQIAAAIPAGLAKQVVDLLTERLAS